MKCARCGDNLCPCTFAAVVSAARREIARRPRWMRDMEAWRRAEVRKADERGIEA